MIPLVCSNLPYLFLILVLVHHCLDVGGKVQVCSGICMDNSFPSFWLAGLEEQYCEDCVTERVSSPLFQQLQNQYCGFASRFAILVAPANRESPKRGRAHSLVALVFGSLLLKP